MNRVSHVEVFSEVSKQSFFDTFQEAISFVEKNESTWAIAFWSGSERIVLDKDVSGNWKLEVR